MLLTINAVISPLKCLGRQWLWLPVDIVMCNIAVRRTWRLPRHLQLVWKLCYSRYISRWRWLCNSETQTFKENIQPTTSSCSHDVLCCYTDWFTTHSKQNRSLQTSFLVDLSNHLANHLLKKLKTQKSWHASLNQETLRHKQKKLWVWSCSILGFYSPRPTFGL